MTSNSLKNSRTKIINFNVLNATGKNRKTITYSMGESNLNFTLNLIEKNRINNFLNR